MRMTEILHFTSSSVSKNDENHHRHHQTLLKTEPLFRYSDRRRRSSRKMAVETEHSEEGDLLAVFLTVLRKSLVSCSIPGDETSGVEEQIMEIGWPTDVKHVAHVTFDRFNGFLGIPVELFPEIPSKPPSASTRVFGVSTESMQLSFDCRGNCVPSILLMMQKSLYSQDGLKIEGIFRINPENSKEEETREKLNQGLIPENIDVHCLAALIKAWFRELPNGILDSLPLEEMMRAHSEIECENLVNLLPQTKFALLNWAVDLMVDVVRFEHLNKMNAHNIAMVFAPNMTKMSDPLTALMHAVQVMNFLKTLIGKASRERKVCLVKDHHIDSTFEIDEEVSDETDDEEHVPSSTSSPCNETRANPCDLVNSPPITLDELMKPTNWIEVEI